MASGRYQPGPSALINSAEIREAVKHRIGLHEETVDLRAWGMHLPQDVLLSDLNRVLGIG